MQTPGAVVVLDVGGTSVKSAVVRRDGLLRGDAQQTPIDSRGAAETIIETLAVIINQHMAALGADLLLGIVLGFPGPFDYATGVSRIQGVAKYEAIYGLNIGQELRSRLGIGDLPLHFYNDATAAIVGETRFGAGRSFSRVIGVTLGTGCGSAFLVDGVPVAGGAGVPPEGVLYHVLFKGQQADDIFSIRGLLARLTAAGFQVDGIKAAARLARNGHAGAGQVFAQFGDDLGVFLRPWTVSFLADGVLLGGGIARSFDLFGPAVAARVPVPVLQNALGAEAALLGAAALFFDQAGAGQDE